MLFPTTVQPLIGAHRGASADAPENTLAAFDLAVEQGAELIEFDVHRALDGALVVIHDSDLRRVTGASGLAGERTAAQLGDLDAGSWKGARWAGERIPTLDQVLDRYGDAVFLNIEIKVGKRPYPGIAAQVAQAVRRRRLYDRVVVSSFEWDIIQELRRRDPAVRAALLAEHRPDEALLYAGELGAVGVHLKAGLITQARVVGARARGLGILAWTVDDPADMQQLAGLNIDAIVSNVPARVRDVLIARRGR
ncbi:MAG TPA: glycerophosphodiester phosphodiesterase family protein [Chloroflexota bacterium]|nr:glycerophosphodiester phosphodiesterase family protein [Chloroflexota bacterium]